MNLLREKELWRNSSNPDSFDVHHPENSSVMCIIITRYGAFPLQIRTPSLTNMPI